MNSKRRKVPVLFKEIEIAVFCMVILTVDAKRRHEIAKLK